MILDSRDQIAPLVSTQNATTETPSGALRRGTKRTLVTESTSGSVGCERELVSGLVFAGFESHLVGAGEGRRRPSIRLVATVWEETRDGSAPLGEVRTRPGTSPWFDLSAHHRRFDHTHARVRR